MTVVYDNHDLLPEEWRRKAGTHIVRAFNPGLLRYQSGWLLAYRVTVEPALQRRIAMCRLDEQLRIVPGSAVPLSDGIRFRAEANYPGQVYEWFADPRLYRLENRLFMYWNSGWHEPQNHQFIIELEPATLRPLGCARELVLEGARQSVEKNWMLFESKGLFAVYAVNPHRVLSFSLTGDGPITFAEAFVPVQNPEGYAKVHGGLRGGSPAVRQGDFFFSFCHSIENDPSGYRYVPAAYAFHAEAPFRPTAMPVRPLEFRVPPEARRSFPKLNPAVGHVIYPGGAATEGNCWVVSFGIDDERCAVTVLEHAEVEATLHPV